MSGHVLAAGTAEKYRAFAAEARGRLPQYVELTIGRGGRLADPAVPRRAAGCEAAAEPALRGGALSARRPGRSPRAARAGQRPRRRPRPRPCWPGARRPTSPRGARPCCPPWHCSPSRSPSSRSARAPGSPCSRTGTPTITAVASSPDGPGRARPQLPAAGPVPIPAQVPEVAWRAGLDLNPLDVTDDDDVRWLECLIWPGETGRRERLAAAIETARRDPPPVRRATC